VADRVVFLRPDAERIARAVRTVEAGNRNETPLRFGRRFEERSGKIFRICTFSGPWAISAKKTVTFKYQTSTPNTASVTNLFFPITDMATRDCAIAKEGTAWFLVDVPLYRSTAVFARATAPQTVVTSVIIATATALSSLSLSAELDTADCSISVFQTANTQSITLVSAVNSAVITLLTSTFTSSFIRLEP
jgi:putative intracellular protease/amidase